MSAVSFNFIPYRDVEIPGGEMGYHLVVSGIMGNKLREGLRGSRRSLTFQKKLYYLLY